MLTYADVCSITLALNEHQAMLPQTHLGTKRNGGEQKALLMPAGIFIFKASRLFKKKKTKRLPGLFKGMCLVCP
jgi:hypothetical protein